MIAFTITGVVLVVLILWDALETMILTHSVEAKLSFTNAYYRIVDRAYRMLGERVQNSSVARERCLAPYGPLSLITLVALWAAMLISGFALINKGLQIQYVSDPQPTFGDHWYASAVTFFTLGYGDMTTTSPIGRVSMVVEAGLGFGFLAAVISYLPVIYSNFSRREATILLLDARAGSPPCATELIHRHGSCGAEPLTELLADFEKWAASLLEATISYPILCYYRSQHEKLGWAAACAVI